MPVSDALRQALQSLTVPGLGVPLSVAKMLKGIEGDDGTVRVKLEWPTPAFPGQDEFLATIRQAAAGQLASGQSLEIETSSQVRGKMTGGAVGLKAKNVIAVGSGKGGVGKSTVATAITYALHSFGCKVGLLDADVYGPSVPHLTGVADQQPMAQPMTLPDGKQITRIIPIESSGVKIMSMGFFLKPDQAVIWRGPLLHRAITQFLSETDWGDLDYLIIDLPPGTGDVALTLSQLLGLAGAVVVCTPQQVALLDAVKAISMYRQVKIPVLGLVENMSGEIFGRGGTRATAEKMGLPCLGEIPMDAAIRIAGDEGRMGTIFNTDGPGVQAFRHVAQQTALQIVKEQLQGPALPSLEIL